MATTGSRRKPLTYAVVYGLFGRESLGRTLQELLEADGLRPAPSVDSADILVAHSAGSWLIPKTAKAKLVLWSGVPLADKRGRAYVQANIQVYKHTTGSRLINFWVSNTYYGFRHFMRNLHIIRMAKHAKPVILPGAAYVFIANRYDPWPRSAQLDAFLETKDWSFISLPGSHDDIWQHPEYYAAIIDHYARLLAQADA